jgi:hypothetical protein
MQKYGHHVVIGLCVLGLDKQSMCELKSTLYLATKCCDNAIFARH